MALGRRQFIAIFGILVIALVAGGKRGQDTVTIPRPSLSDDFLLSRLPAQSFRLDSSRLIFADGETTQLLSDVDYFSQVRLTEPIYLGSAFKLDAFRGAPALRLSQGFELPLGQLGNPGDYSLVLVAKSKSVPEFQITSYSLTYEDGRWGLKRFDNNMDTAKGWVSLTQHRESPKLHITEGLELAELILLSQPLSSLQSENISESLYRKWINQIGL